MRTPLLAAAVALVATLTPQTQANAGPEDLTCPAFEDILMSFERQQRYSRANSTPMPSPVGDAMFRGEPQGNPRYVDLTKVLEMPRHVWNFTDADMDRIRDRADFCIRTAAQWEMDGDPTNERERINSAVSTIENIYRAAKNVREHRERVRARFANEFPEKITTDNAAQTVDKLADLQEFRHRVGRIWFHGEILKPLIGSYKSWAESLIQRTKTVQDSERSAAELADLRDAYIVYRDLFSKTTAGNGTDVGESANRLKWDVESAVQGYRNRFLQTYVERTLPSPESFDGTPVDLVAAALSAYRNESKDPSIEERSPETWRKMNRALRKRISAYTKHQKDYLCDRAVNTFDDRLLENKVIDNGRGRFVPLELVVCRLGQSGLDVRLGPDWDHPNIDGKALLIRVEPAYDRVNFGKFGAFEYINIIFAEVPDRDNAYKPAYAEDSTGKKGQLSESAWAWLLKSLLEEIKMGWPKNLEK